MATGDAGVEFLTERRMRAADALLHHGECLDVAFVYADGQRRMCRLAGRAEQDATVVLSVWSLGNRVLSNRPVLFEEVALYPDVALRLDAVARAQESGPEARLELARCKNWLSTRQRRNLSGQFTGHHCEPAGRR